MDESDIEAIARLHVVCMHDSLVTALGASYARSFYRYVTRSAREVTVTECDATGHIVAVAVISLEPSSFHRRLLLHTSLLPNLVMNVGGLLALLWSSRVGLKRSPNTHDQTATSSYPEMILIFTAPEARRHGYAAALVQQAERRLGLLGIPVYQVRTVLSPSNGALTFYRDQQFVPSGISVRLGTRFQVFTKQLGRG
jgi:GNAT superfamily N-acetyltransferase